MQQLTDAQKKALDSDSDGFAPESHPIRDLWLNVTDALVRVITIGNGRVVLRQQHRAPIRWDGVIK